MACAKDRYAATYVVAAQLGPPDCQAADFTDLQDAINNLTSAGRQDLRQGRHLSNHRQTIKLTSGVTFISRAKAWASP